MSPLYRFTSIILRVSPHVTMKKGKLGERLVPFLTWWHGTDATDTSTMQVLMTLRCRQQWATFFFFDAGTDSH